MINCLRVAALLWLAACNGAAEQVLSAPPSQSSSDSLMLIHAAGVIPMDRPGVLERHSILVRRGRVVQISPAEQLMGVAGAKVVDARGKYVIPGLIDMHVHIDRADLGAYVQHGVTTVRNMWGFQQLAAIIADVAAGRVRGPEIHSLSSGFDGSPVKWPQTQLVDDLAQIAPLMQQQMAQGYREIKVYQDLSRAAYDSIIAIARARGLTFAGHVPTRVPLLYALQQGQRSIEHLGSYQLEQIDGQARATAQAGTWNCPTLAILAQLDPGRSGTRISIVKALHDAGARLLAGTDSGIGRTMPGASIADELRLLVEAGLSPYEALRGATIDAAEYLHLENEAGVIKPGARADLVILDANPLRDIAAVRRIRTVILRGEIL